MFSLWKKLLLQRRTIPLQQLHRRTPRYLHTVSPHILSYMLKHLPRSEMLLQPYRHSHSPITTATAQLTSRRLLLLHLLLHHTMLYILYQIVILHQGWDFPLFHLYIEIDQLCRVPGLVCCPSVTHGLQWVTDTVTSAAALPSSNAWSLPYLPSKECSCGQHSWMPTQGILEKV